MSESVHECAAYKLITTLKGFRVLAGKRALTKKQENESRAGEKADGNWALLPLIDQLSPTYELIFSLISANKIHAAPVGRFEIIYRAAESLELSNKIICFPRWFRSLESGVLRTIGAGPSSRDFRLANDQNYTFNPSNSSRAALTH